MNAEQVDDLIMTLSVTYSQRTIARRLQIGRQWIRDVLAMHAEGRRLEYQLGRPVKATGQIKQWVIEATPDDRRASDSQIVRMVFDKFGGNIGHSTANRIRPLVKF
jgi:transposase